MLSFHIKSWNSPQTKNKVVVFCVFFFKAFLATSDLLLMSLHCLRRNKLKWSPPPTTRKAQFSLKSPSFGVLWKENLALTFNCSCGVFCPVGGRGHFCFMDDWRRDLSGLWHDGLCCLIGDKNHLRGFIDCNGVRAEGQSQHPNNKKCPLQISHLLNQQAAPKIHHFFQHF